MENDEKKKRKENEGNTHTWYRTHTITKPEDRTQRDERQAVREPKEIEREEEGKAERESNNRGEEEISEKMRKKIWEMAEERKTKV